MPAVAVTEPDFGSDVAGVTVTAVPGPGPDGEPGWVINGVKTWCTFAARSRRAGAARTHRSRSQQGAPRPEPVRRAEGARRWARLPAHAGAGRRSSGRDGGSADRHHRLPGACTRTSSRSQDWWVPADNLVGGEAGLGQGFYLQMAGFENGRLQTAARALGVMQAAYEAALEYAEHRRVFDRQPDRVPAHAGQARADGDADPGRAPVRLPASRA